MGGASSTNRSDVIYWHILSAILNMGPHAGIHAEKDREMRETEYRRKLLNLQIIQGILAEGV